MKLENEHVLSAQTSPRKSYNPFESDDEDTNGYAKNNINGYDIKSFESTPDSLTFHLDTSNLSWEEAILGHTQILSNTIPADASSEEVLYRKDSELFTDKTVTDCELPKSVFSYKDNGFQSVKDIVIDEGVPTLDKVWIKSQDNHESTKLSTILGLNDNFHGDMSFMEGLKSRANDAVEKDPNAQDNPIEVSVKENGLVHEVLQRPYSANQCKPDDLLKVDEFRNDISKKEDASNFGWQRTGDLVESGSVINGKRDPQLCEKDEVNCHKVEDTENEVSEKEHSKDNLPLVNEGESLAKPSIMHESVEARESDEANHTEKFPAKSNEVHYAESFLAKPTMVHEVQATTESDEVHHAEMFSAKPVIAHQLETTTESNEVHHAEMFLAKPSMMREVEATTESNEIHHAEIFPAKTSMVHEVEATTESNEVHHPEIYPAKPIIMHGVEATVDESRNEEATLAQFVKLPGLQEPAGSDVINSLPYNSKVESGSIILDFNAAATSSGTDKEEIVQKEETTVEIPPGAQSMSRDDCGSLPGCNSILDNDADNRVHGETSFSAAMPPPASITYMGPSAHSGNISHRSESSAGSTRSFAFPVLQAEWNSSPVRMAKADQGYFRKQKGWVHSIVCCKF